MAVQKRFLLLLLLHHHHHQNHQILILGVGVLSWLVLCPFLPRLVVVRHFLEPCRCSSFFLCEVGYLLCSCFSRSDSSPPSLLLLLSSPVTSADPSISYTQISELPIFFPFLLARLIIILFSGLACICCFYFVFLVFLFNYFFEKRLLNHKIFWLKNIYINPHQILHILLEGLVKPSFYDIALSWNGSLIEFAIPFYLYQLLYIKFNIHVRNSHVNIFYESLCLPS